MGTAKGISITKKKKKKAANRSWSSQAKFEVYTRAILQ